MGGRIRFAAPAGINLTTNYKQVTASIYRFPDSDQGDPVQTLWRMQNEPRLQTRETNEDTQDH